MASAIGMKMRIENRRTYKGPGVYVGRPSTLGNPYVIGQDGDRDTVVHKYRLWLNEQVKQRVPRIMAALRAIEPDETLVCWCWPERCHAEVVAKAVEYVRANGL